MRNKYIIVKGAAGLGNRLITLTTAITYAKKTNRQLIVHWGEGQFYKKGENAFFHCFDLKDIEYKENVESIENIDTLSVYPADWKQFIHSHNFKFRYVDNFPALTRLMQEFNIRGSLGKIGGYWQVRQPGMAKRASRKEKFKGFFSLKAFPHSSIFSYNRKEDVVVYLDYQPSKYEVNDFLAHVALKPHMEAIVQEYTDKFQLDKNAVGIHVRATDRKPTKDISTILKKVKALGLTDPQIFLATDNSEVYHALKKDFPKLFSFSENVPKPPTPTRGIHHHFNDETSYEMFKQSVVDMWLLSKCEYLFYQGNSSFSLISKLLHKDQSKVFDWMADK